MSFTITITIIINNISCQELVSSVERSLHDDGWGKNMDRDTIATGHEVDDDMCVLS